MKGAVQMKARMDSKPVVLARFSDAPADCKPSKFKIYANSENRKKRQRLLTSSIDMIDPHGNEHQLHYFGKNYDKTDDEVTNSMVGVYDKSTGELQLLPVGSIFPMKQWHKHVSLEEYLFQDVKLGLQKRELINTFGARKRQAQMRASDANRIKVESVSGAGSVAKLLEKRVKSAEMGLKKEQDEQQEMVDSSSPTKNTAEAPGDATSKPSDSTNLALQQGRQGYLPPFNMAATKPAQVYDPKLIIPPSEWSAMEGERQRFIEALEEVVGEGGNVGNAENAEAEGDFWKNERLPFSVARLMKRVLKDRSKKTTDKHVLYLLYCRYLVRLFKNKFPLRRKTPEQLANSLGAGESMPAPVTVVTSLLGRFARADPSCDGYTRDERAKTKLLMHLLALLLPVSGFRLDPVPVASDLNITPKQLGNYLRELGCKVSRVRETGEDGARTGTQKSVATLPVPLTFPKPKRKRAS